MSPEDVESIGDLDEYLPEVYAQRCPPKKKIKLPVKLPVKKKGISISSSSDLGDAVADDWIIDFEEIS